MPSSTDQEQGSTNRNANSTDFNFFNNFPYMYVGLFVRNECKRSVKNQGSRGELVEVATSS